ncbi:MAG TPA: toprim domain-containing protein [bacterium]|nr:toprim domain-containing protein [bacterium]
MKFKLTLDSGHPYLLERDLIKSTIENFGLGLCHRGMLRGKIAIPIHDHEGSLVAYAGRNVNGEWPKYRFPIGFHKSQVVFNLRRAKCCNSPELIIVEGFFDCFKVHQAGFQNVVALMGCSLSECQRRLVLSLKRRLLILLDGDVVGRKATKQLVQALRGKLPVIPKYVPLGKQPDNLDEKSLQRLIGTRR